MKRFMIVAGILVFIGALAVPVMAHGPGRGRGGHMMGYWGGGGGPGYYRNYDRGYGNLTDEQRTKLDEASKAFYDDTAKLRDEIWTKRNELNALLNSSEPDIQKAKALQKEISNLKAQLDEKRLNYRLEVRKIAPEGSFAPGYGRGHGRHMWGYGYGPGMGYGMHMGGYGPGMGYGMPMMGGYGPGTCWND